MIRFQRINGIFFRCLVIWIGCIPLILYGHLVEGFEIVDVVPGVIESPQFKGKDPLSSLRLAADLLHEKKLKPSDMSFLLLDWGDQYLRDTSDPLERLKRWTDLTNDEKLSQLKIPRDFLNRILLAEYLVTKTAYLKSSPQKRLEIISKLEEKNLVDWSVALAYARLYAGAILTGSKGYETTSPLEALNILKKLEDGKLVGWHYRVPIETILVAEALAMDKDYQQASPLDRLSKLRDLERKGLITAQTKRELEKLPAWRLLVTDPTFLKADAKAKKDRLSKLETEGMISASTCSDLKSIFRPASWVPSIKTKPSPLPQKISPPGN
jgi:hypothetical protein